MPDPESVNSYPTYPAAIFLRVMAVNGWLLFRDQGSGIRDFLTFPKIDLSEKTLVHCIDIYIS
jgi:hypothetical protein